MKLDTSRLTNFSRYWLTVTAWFIFAYTMSWVFNYLVLINFPNGDDLVKLNKFNIVMSLFMSLWLGSIYFINVVKKQPKYGLKKTKKW